MPRVHFVKKARKDNPAVKAGESYYYWEFRYGGKRYSATRPRPSQLTQSNFLGTMYAVQEAAEDAVAAGIDSIEALQEAIEAAADELDCLRDEAQESFDNMPEPLQQGPTGEMLEQRVQYVEEMVDNLRNLDLEIEHNEISDFSEDELEGLDDDEKEMLLEETRQEEIDALVNEFQSALEYEGE